jgi:hypothetical protein
MTTTPAARSYRFGSGGDCQLVLPRVDRGGEGEIFRLRSQSDLVLKLYHPDVLAERGATLAVKIPAMIENPPDDPTREQDHVSLAWPLDTVVDQQGVFTGYVMPFIDTSSSAKLHMVSNPSDRKRSEKAPDWLSGFRWDYLLRTATNLASATQALHEKGYVIGDFNESNVLVRQNTFVTLVDCDSMQVPSPSGNPFLCRLMRPEFTAPELIHENLAVVPRTQESDLFPLAVHIYQLLMEGRHPFAGVWHARTDKPERHELAARGLFVQKGDKSLTPQAGTPAFAILTDEVRALFLRAFVNGAKDPGARPSALEWYEALQAMATTLVTCETEAAHKYAGHLQKKCPWCVLDTLSQIAVAPPTAQVPLPPAVAARRPKPPVRPPRPPVRWQPPPRPAQLRPRTSSTTGRFCVPHILVRVLASLWLVLNMVLLIVWDFLPGSYFAPDKTALDLRYLGLDLVEMIGVTGAFIAVAGLPALLAGHARWLGSASRLAGLMLVLGGLSLFAVGEYTAHSVGCPGSLGCPGVLAIFNKTLGLDSFPSVAAEPAQSSEPSSSFDPNSPEGVASAILSAQQQGDWNKVCSLFQPSFQVLCMVFEHTTTRVTGSFQIRGAVIQDTRALVAVTGSMNFPGGSTGANQDPTQGMPPAAGTFDQAWTSDSRATLFSPLQCVNIGGRWYAYFPYLPAA